MNSIILLNILSKAPIPPMPPRNKWGIVGDTILLILWALAAVTGKIN